MILDSVTLLLEAVNVFGSQKRAQKVHVASKNLPIFYNTAYKTIFAVKNQHVKKSVWSEFRRHKKFYLEITYAGDGMSRSNRQRTCIPTEISIQNMYFPPLFRGIRHCFCLDSIGLNQNVNQSCQKLIYLKTHDFLKSFVEKFKKKHK